MAIKQVTVKDIASKLKLHYTTVSKALSNHPDISVATKHRVLSIAKELDYHPNSIAKNLKKQGTSTLGVIVPSIKNDFFSAVISGIEEGWSGRSERDQGSYLHDAEAARDIEDDKNDRGFDGGNEHV